MRDVVLWLALASLLAACGIREKNLRQFDDQRPATQQERATIAGHIRKNYLDPYSVRDARISSVSPNASELVHVCVISNAKNSMGAYTGQSATMYRLNSFGEVHSVAERDFFAEQFCLDPRLKYVPFSEIEEKR
jgi:hypothetical protein